MARLHRAPTLNEGIAPSKKTPQDLDRRATFYDDMSKRLHQRKLAERMLEPRDSGAGEDVVDDGSIATRFTMDGEEEELTCVACVT